MDNDLANNADLNSAVEIVLARAEEVRPKNTTNQYEPRQKEFKDWCTDERKFADGVIVTEWKLLLFLQDKVQPRSNKKTKGSDGQPLALGVATHQAYIKAIVALYQTQKTLKLNSNEHPRGAAIKSFLDIQTRGEEARRRANLEDRGKNTGDDGYDEEELLRLGQWFLHPVDQDGSGGKAEVSDLRNRADFLIGNATLTRGDSRRLLQLADLFSVALPKTEGPTESFVFAFAMRQGKTNQHGKVQYAPFLRHKDVRICPVGALAQYLVARYHCDKEEFPDFADPSSWYDVHFLKGKKRTAPMAYNTERDAYKRAFVSCGVHTSKLTHANRTSGVRIAELNGASELSLRRLGQWSSGTMEDCYLRSFPLGSMRPAAGFPPTPGSFYLRRALVPPPMELQEQIFPSLSNWKERFRSGDESLHISGHAFVKTLDCLRKIFLEDSVELMQINPDLMLWKLPLFSSPMYLNYKTEATAVAAANVEGPLEMRLQLAMPDLSNTISSGFSALGSKIDAVSVASQRQSAIHGKAMAKLGQGLNDLTIRLENAARTYLQPCENGSSSTNHGSRSSNSRSIGNSGYDNVEADVEGEPEDDVEGEAVPDVGEEELEWLDEDGSVEIHLDPKCLYHYFLDRTLTTITDIWREYDEGIGRHPPVRRLEEVYKAKWRPSEKERKFFSRRKTFYTLIINEAKRLKISEQCSATKLEAFRTENQLTLDTLRIEILKTGISNFHLE